MTIRSMHRTIAASAVSFAAFVVAVSPALAHEGEQEFTNVAEADWVGPAVAIAVLVAFWVAAWLVRRHARRRKAED